MLSIFDGIRGLDFLSVTIRLLTAFACGAVIGLERSYKNKPAGFRTHILVCLGAAIAAMTGMYIYLYDQLPADMSRIAAGVVTGLGFIGAGTIIVTKKNQIKGLTTAAGLWTTGLVGLAIGAGFFEGGLLGTFMIILIETYFNNIREKIIYAPEFRIALSYYHRTDLDKVLRYCKDSGLSISNLQITGNTEAGSAIYSALISLKAVGKIEPEEIASAVRNISGIISAEVI